MAAAERRGYRNGVSRRSMAMLGKVPIVPKPINLPSLRSTFCWDKFSKGEDLSGKYESALVDPVDCNDGFDLQAKKTQSSRANSVNTAMESNNVQKTEEAKTSGTFTKNRKQDATGPSLQKGGDVASVPPGFNQNDQGNNSKPSIASMHAQSNGVASCSETQQSGSQNRTGAKDREIIVIHMVGAPGFPGGFPPYFGFPESYDRNRGVSANFPLQFGNFEPFFGLPGNGAAYMPTSAGSEFHDQHEGYICYEKECFKGSRHDAGKHRNSWMHGSFRDRSFVGGIHGEAYDPLLHGTEHRFRSRSLSHRHVSRNAGRPRCLYQDGRVVSLEERNSEPVSEKQVTLLTKLHELYDDEGKAPIEIPEDNKIDEVKTEASQPKEVSTNLEIMGNDSISKETAAGTLKGPLSKIGCNDNCLHCKGTAVTVGSPTSLCQSCEKTTVCESSFSSSQCCMKLAEEVPVSTALKDSSVDGCKADVKYIILNADNHSNSAVKTVAACQHQETAKENNEYSIKSPLNNSEVVEAGTGRLSDTSVNKSERQQKLVYVKKPQAKLTSKPGIRVGKAHVKTKRFRLQDHKLIPAISSISSSNLEGISELAKQQLENGVHEINSPTTPLSPSTVSNLGTSSVTGVNEKNDKPRKFVYRKRIAEQVANGPQPRKKEGEIKRPIESLLAVVQVEHETEKGGNLANLIPSASGFVNHISEEKACHVVEGSDGHLLLPTASLSSGDNDKKKLEKVKGSKLSTKATSSLHCAHEALLIQKPAVEIKLLDSFTKDKSDAVNCSLPSSRISWSSRQELNTTKKFAKQLSAWRPKVKCNNAAGSGSSSVTEEEKEANFSTSALLGAGEEYTGASNTGFISDLDFLHPGKTEDKGFLENTQDDFCLQLKSSSDGANSGENNQLSNHQAESFVPDMRFENLPERNIPQEEVKEPLKEIGELALCSPVVCNSENNLDLKEEVKEPLKEIGELAICGPVVCNAENNLDLKEGKEINRLEMIAVVSKPFIKKKSMSFEEADRYHQILFKRYKEIGQWRAKTSVQNKKLIKKKENVCPHEDDMKLPT